MYLLNKLFKPMTQLSINRGFASLLLVACINHKMYAQINNIPLQIWNPATMTAVQGDWLIQKPTIKANVYQSLDGKDIVLYNGLLKREFRLQPNLVCTDFTNLVNGQQLLRATSPEAKLIINGHLYAVGGLSGQGERAYFKKEWLNNMVARDSDFQYSSYTISELQPFIHWKRKGWAADPVPAGGKQIAFIYHSSLKDLQGIIVTVHYELYDGIPLIVKWVSVENKGDKPIMVNRIVNEVLALPEEESAVVGSPEQMKKQHGIYVETNYAFNNAMRYDISDQTTHWKTDSSYTSQVNYNYQTPCLLEVYPEKVTGNRVQPDEVMNSVRTQELLMDSYDRERRGLAIRKMYRAIAPWTTENPIFMHLVSKNDGEVKAAIDQCAATGYEAVILSFGSHCNMEDSSAANIARWKQLADYAHHRNIRIGGYSLFSSRKISDADDVIDPATEKPDAAAFFGNAPCLGSNWGLSYIAKLKYFISNTGFDIFENDGPYPGDVCASTLHPGHIGLDDSQWKQMNLQKELYHWCNERGVYVNAPDWYFLDGTNKIAIGYREVNFSLSREQQLILNRQNIFDGLWEKSPSMSWGFVPLTKYQGGGPEAILEPLSEHLKDYDQLMFQYYGAGVQACYRGPRLYDTEKTKQTVSHMISWYKQYRDILNADIIHLRRPDGRDWDGIMHVNPALKTKGLLLLFNPLKIPVTRTIQLPLYYTGLTGTATITEKGVSGKKYTLNRNYEITFTFTIAAESYNWYVIE